MDQLNEKFPLYFGGEFETLKEWNAAAIQATEELEENVRWIPQSKRDIDVVELNGFSWKRLHND